MGRFFTIFILASLMAFQASAQKFSCLPCGRTCDAKIYDSAGACAECGMKLVDASTIKFKTVDFAQLCERLKVNKDILLLDVRSPQEFNGTMKDYESFGRFKKAVNINIREIGTRVGEIEKYKNKEVIVYCSHSHRSPEVSYFLSTHGFTNVSNVAGGVSTFKDSKGADCLKDQYIAFK